MLADTSKQDAAPTNPLETDIKRYAKVGHRSHTCPGYTCHVSADAEQPRGGAEAVPRGDGAAAPGAVGQVRAGAAR